MHSGSFLDTLKVTSRPMLISSHSHENIPLTKVKTCPVGQVPHSGFVCLPPKHWVLSYHRIRWTYHLFWCGVLTSLHNGVSPAPIKSMPKPPLTSRDAGPGPRYLGLSLSGPDPVPIQVNGSLYMDINGCWIRPSNCPYRRILAPSYEAAGTGHCWRLDPG